MSVAAVTLIAAVVATVIGVGTFCHLFLMVMRWPRATGTVVGNVTERRSIHMTQYAYFPRIEFEAADGRTYEVRGDIGLDDEWPLGRKVDLRYRPSNPNHTTTMKGWQRLVFSLFFVGLAVACWYAWLDMAAE